MSAVRATLSLVVVLAVTRPAAADVGDLVGRAAPELRARDVETEEPRAVEDYRGRAVLVVFVATWCGACRRLAPELEALRRAHGEQDLVILAVSHEPRDRIRRHVRANAPGVPWLQCTGRTAIRYEADVLPTAVLIDREGRVRAALQGVERETVAALREAIADLLALGEEAAQ